VPTTGQDSEPANLQAQLNGLQGSVADLRSRLNAPHPHTIRYYIFSIAVPIIVGAASMGVVAYVGHQARVVAEANLKVAEANHKVAEANHKVVEANHKVSEENLRWLRETHERDIGTNRRMKAHDAADRFFTRFYEIEKDKDRKKPSDFYYEQIYGLHFDEFITYTDGFLDKDLYETWLRFRWLAYHIPGSDEPKQWERLKGTYILNRRFITFMDEIFKATDEDAVKVILDKFKSN
jgi:hypothetical protein